MSHTPGPWVIELPKNEYDEEVMPSWGQIKVADGRHITVEGRTREEAGANLKLVAAAPDLLDACERAERLFDSGPLQFSREHVSELSAIRAAIAKAKGVK